MVLGAGAQREVAENELKFSLRMEEENAGLDHSAKSQKMSLRWSFSAQREVAENGIGFLKKRKISSASLSKNPYSHVVSHFESHFVSRVVSHVVSHVL